MLEMAQWANRFDVETLVHEDYWSERDNAEDAPPRTE
jgi:hypothetical protein